MKFLERTYLAFLVPVLLLFLTDCAKIGTLSGGPADKVPPVALKCVPANYSVNFHGQKIEITFDEFITLDNINQQLVVSPPLEKRVDVKLKNKTVLINLNSELQDSTTYTLNFGDAIKDLDEGNILRNYEYVFSTGPYLDSLSVYGRVVDAFTLEPPEDPVSILLYEDLSDSAFLKHIPMYVGKTGKDGYFALNNLRADTFHIFALTDLNSNFRFDLPGEKIAFLDSALHLNAENYSRLKIDSLLLDSLNVESDSLLQSKIDSLRRPEVQYAGKTLVNLFMFEENNEKQYLTDFNRRDRRRLEFSFNNPVTDSFRMISLRPDYENWYLKEVNPGRDTFNLWITDPDVIGMDTVRMKMNFTGLDTMGNKVTLTDTVTFSFREPLKTRRKPKEEAPDTTLKLNTIKDRSTLELNQPIVITADVPLAAVDTSSDPPAGQDRFPLSPSEVPPLERQRAFPDSPSVQFMGGENALPPVAPARSLHRHLRTHQRHHRNQFHHAGRKLLRDPACRSQWRRLSVDRPINGFQGKYFGRKDGHP